MTWSIIAGSLPAGLSLGGTTGVLSGTPTTIGTSSFTASVVDANGKTATKVTSIVISAGPLVIVKSANVSTSVAGGIVLYTVTVTNTAATAFTGVSVADPLTGVLDDAVYNANASATSGTVSYAAPTISWTGTIPANSAVTITYSVTVATPDVGNQVLANTVTSTTLGTNCASGSVDTRCAATVTVAGLTIVKTADVASTTPGSVVHFQIVVTDSGQTAYTGATLTDSLAGVLDDGVYNADATATTGSVTLSGGALIWTGNLAVGAASTITYSVTVASPDGGNKSLTGTVVSPTAGSSCPGGNPAASCTAVVTVLVPALAIGITSTVSSTTPLSVVPYTVTLTNSGQTAYTATSVTVALAGALDDATYNGLAVSSAGSVVFSAGPGTLVWTGNLAIGAVVTITASLAVRNPDPGDKTMTTVVSSAAPGSTCPVGSSNSACTSTISVLIPALTIAKSVDSTSTTPGTVVHDTILVTNTGQTPYVAATLADSLAGVLDDASYNANAVATSGTVTFAGQTVGWTGNLLVGASATITYSVTVSKPDTGDLILADTVVSTTQGNNCPAGGTDVRCTTTVGVLIPGLGFTIAPSTTSTTPGGVVQYVVTATNTGQTAYAAASITLNLDGLNDDATYNYDAVTSAGSLITNPDGTVNWILPLAIGAHATGTLSFTVNSPASGDKSMVLAVVSDSPRKYLPDRGNRGGLFQHRRRADPRPDHHQDRRHPDDQSRWHCQLHHLRGQLRSDQLQRSCFHRLTGLRPVRRRLLGRSHRLQRHPDLQRPHPVLERSGRPRSDRDDPLCRHREGSGPR